jgi:hypothetical protein
MGLWVGIVAGWLRFMHQRRADAWLQELERETPD